MTTMPQPLGKIVTARMPKRDNAGKLVTGQFDTLSGICTFLGPNEFLGIPLQATISRMPVTLSSIEDIQLS